MSDIIKLAFQGTKPGYKRVRRKCKGAAEHPDQLSLFAATTAQILAFTPDLTPFEQALFWDERGDARAAELYEKAIHEQDCTADAYCNLGILETRRGNPLKAFDCFTTALRHDARHSEAHYNLGNLYFDLNDFRLAQLHFQITTEVDPDFANAWFNLALAQTINNDPAAERSLNTYQELVPPEEMRQARELISGLRQSVTAANLPSTPRTHGNSSKF